MNHIIVCHNKISHLKKAIVDAGYQVAKTWYPKFSRQNFSTNL